MMLGSNFDPKARMDGNDVNVSGSSDPIEGTELVMRHVALQQGGRAEHATTPLSGKWVAVIPQPLDAFVAGRAVATGVETYFAKEPTPAFMTLTWSQDITIEGS